MPSIEMNPSVTAYSEETIELGSTLSLKGVRLRFERNKEIFGQGEPSDYIYRVVSGAVRSLRFSNDGHRQILAFHLPGDVFGLELGDRHDFSAEAVTDSEIVMVRRSLLNKTASESHDASRALLQLTAQSLLSAHEHSLMLGRKGADERVAAFILHMADRISNKQELDLPMPRSDIADFLGLTIESVSRAFTKMQRQSAISLPSARHVVVRSRSALSLMEAA